MYWQPFFNRAEGTEGESGTRAAGWGQGGDGAGVFLVPAGPGIAMSLGRKIMSGKPSIIFKSQLHDLKRIAQNPLPPPSSPPLPHRKQMPCLPGFEVM